MLKIKKSHIKDEWIVYNPDSFKTCHTHVRHKRIALKIKFLVENKIIPNSRNIYFVDSCIRVAKNKPYLRRLEEYRSVIK